MEQYMPITPPDLFEAAPYGLLSVLNWDVETDGHWQGGVFWDATCTDVSVTSSPCVSGAPSSLSLSRTTTVAYRGARPFTVYAEMDCSAAAGGWDLGQQRALDALNKSTPSQLEATFWTGASGGAPVFPNLSTTGPIRDSSNEFILQPASTLISGQPLDVVEAIGRLESAMAAAFDGVGVIHVPAILGPALVSRALCRPQGSALRTYAGNYVAIGQGYPGTGPDGSSPVAGTAWIRATSRPFAIKANPRVFQQVTTLDRTVDTVKAIAQQTYLIGWNCSLIGVLVTTGGELAGEFGDPKAAT